MNPEIPYLVSGKDIGTSISAAPSPHRRLRITLRLPSAHHRLHITVCRLRISASPSFRLTRSCSLLRRGHRQQFHRQFHRLTRHTCSLRRGLLPGYRSRSPRALRAAPRFAFGVLASSATIASRPARWAASQRARAATRASLGACRARACGGRGRASRALECRPRACRGIACRALTASR